MAYKRYKKFSAKRTRKRPRYSRRYYRRRHRTSYWRRSRGNRRFPKSTEAKLVEYKGVHSWEFNQELANADVTFYPGFFHTIGSNTYGINILQGTGTNQRIGAKVTPIKLRISGVLSFDRKFSLAEPIIPESFHIRMFVYQVRGGNSDKDPTSADYHNLALHGVVTNGSMDGRLDGKEIQKLLNFYSITAATPSKFTNGQMRDNMGAGKTPLRLGIGGQFKMLYTKTFKLSSSSTSSIPFRIVTKVPNRLVWPEKPNGTTDETPASCPRNAVYVAWLIVPQTTSPIGNVYLNFQTQLFYIDK